MKPFYTKKADVDLYGNIDNIIATGSHGTVYNTTNGYAVKITSDTQSEDDADGESMTFLREVLILRSLNHPNILKLLAVCDVKSNKRALYMNRAIGTLQDQIHKNVEKDIIQYWMYQLLKGLEYCHKNHIIHRDVKPPNILLFDDGNLQLADFGLARSFTASGNTHTDEVVTIWWRAPELLLGEQKYSYEIDIWSVGIILCTILLKEHKFKGDEITQLQKIFKVLGTPTEKDWPGVTTLPNWKNIPTFPRMDLKLSPEESDLLYKLLDWSPNRITATNALQHCYFDNIRDMDTEYSSAQNDKPIIYASKTAFDVNNRYILFDWLYVIKDTYGLSYNTLFMTYSIFDRYIEKKPTMRKHSIQGYGVASLLIATKLLEPAIIDVDTFVYLTIGTFTHNTIRKMERNILIALDYNLDVYPYSFILKDRGIPVTEVMMLYLVAIYLNYDWITTWSIDKCISLLQQKEHDRETLIYFAGLTGCIGNKIRQSLSIKKE